MAGVNTLLTIANSSFNFLIYLRDARCQMHKLSSFCAPLMRKFRMVNYSYVIGQLANLQIFSSFCMKKKRRRRPTAGGKRVSQNPQTQIFSNLCAIYFDISPFGREESAKINCIYGQSPKTGVELTFQSGRHRQSSTDKRGMLHKLTLCVPFFSLIKSFSYPINTDWSESRIRHMHIQGDPSACPKPPVDFDVKVAF